MTGPPVDFQAICRGGNDEVWRWSAVGNDCKVEMETMDPDLQVEARPVFSDKVMGVELIDTATGLRLAIAVRARRVSDG